MLKKRILLKLGSNTLTKDTDHISRGKIAEAYGHALPRSP